MSHPDNNLEFNPAGVRKNEYDGYAAGALQRLGRMRLRLDFNARIVPGEDTINRFEGFSLRLMERPEDIAFHGTRTEFGLLLSEDEWEALVESMWAELESVREWRSRNQGGRQEA